MNAHVLRERRSHARKPVDFPPSLRVLVEAAIEGLINVLDRLDDDADLEETADLEPLLGWAEREAEKGIPVQATDEAEDGFDDEPTMGWSNDYRTEVSPVQPALDELEPPCEDEGAQCDDDGGEETDCSLTLPETGAGMPRFCEGADELAARIEHDPRLGLRAPLGDDPWLWGANLKIPQFPWDTSHRPRMQIDVEKARLEEAAWQIRWRRKAKRRKNLR